MGNIDWKSLGIAAAILYGAYKFGPDKAKGAVMAIGAVILAKQVPYVQDYV